ncbi:hypothetical protein MASR2M15_28980 [Anaerolineales bacterium]
MTVYNQIEQSYEFFTQKIQEYGLILLHPDSKFRSVNIAKLLSDENFDTTYYTFKQDDDNLKSFIIHLTIAINIKFPYFGDHVFTLAPEIMQNSQENIDSILNAFLLDLKNIQNKSFILLFDDYDLCEKVDDIQLFIQKFLIRLPDNIHIIINGRSLPRNSWVSLIAQNRALILKDNELLISDFHQTTNQTQAPLQIYGLGPSMIIYQNNLVEDWEGHLPKLLLFYTLNRPKVTRFELCNAFWKGLDTEQAINIFHVSKRRLHKAVDVDLLYHDDGFYFIDPTQNYYFDALDFAESLSKAREATDQQKQTHYQRALQLYRGDYLQGHEEKWIQVYRKAFRKGFIEAKLNLAHYYTDQTQYSIALQHLLDASEYDPFNHGIHQQILTLYHHLGRRMEGVEYFHHYLSNMLKEKLRPDKKVMDAYEALTS